MIELYLSKEDIERILYGKELSNTTKDYLKHEVWLYEKNNRIQHDERFSDRENIVLSFRGDIDPDVIQDMLRHAETSDPSIGRDQQDECGIFFAVKWGVGIWKIMIFISI